MRIKKLVALAASVMMVMSMATTAFASDDYGDNLSVQVVDEFTTKELPELDISKVSQSTELPLAPYSSKAPKNLDQGEKISDISLSKSARSTARSVTQSWNGTLQAQGELTYVMATLAPNQILTASLICPKSPDLNYDLYVYSVTPDGYLGDVLSSSVLGTQMNTYPDGTVKTADEGVSYINTTSQTNSYAIIVMSAQGGSTTDMFTLTLSVDVEGSYDAAEPNDSAFYARSITDGSLPGASIHISNDQDWYIWKATSEFQTAEILASAGCAVEVYTADGNKLNLKNINSDGTYNIATGANYIKVFSDGTSATPSNYTLSVTPKKVTAAIMKVALSGDQGDYYPTYNGVSRFSFQDKISPKVKIESASGYAVVNHPVKLYWESGSWNDFTGNKTRETTVNTDSQGIARPSLTVPISLGSHSVFLSGAISFIHYYDIDGIIISSPGTNPYTNVVYHFMRSDYV